VTFDPVTRNRGRVNMAAAAVTDVAPKKKKKSIFGMLHVFQRKKSKSKEKKVRANKWLCVCIKTSPSGVTEGGG